MKKIVLGLVVSTAILSANNYAIQKAKMYLNTMPFSKEGLIHQLEYDKFSNSNARNAVNSLNVNWKQQAVRKGKQYLQVMPFSCKKLEEQLEYDKFTPSQAYYGAQHTDACK